jgi:hypothetical protein
VSEVGKVWGDNIMVSRNRGSIFQILLIVTKYTDTSGIFLNKNLIKIDHFWAANFRTQRLNLILFETLFTKYFKNNPEMMEGLFFRKVLQE